MFGRKAAKREQEKWAADDAAYLRAKEEYDNSPVKFLIGLEPEGWTVQVLVPPLLGFTGGFQPAFFSTLAGPFTSKAKAEAWLREHAKGPRPYDKNGKALTK